MAEITTPDAALAKLSINESNAKSNGSSNDSGTVANSAEFKEQFKAFSKFGDTKSDGKLITLSQSDKWMKQAKVIDKKITTTDTAIHFKKLKSLKVNFTEYNKFLDDLATTKKVELSEMKKKLGSCGAPGFAQINNVSWMFRFGFPYYRINIETFHFDFHLQEGKAAAAVARLTDPSKYTGSHKERFDETGKGKGIAGRKDLRENSGYVSGYTHKDTYDKMH